MATNVVGITALLKKHYDKLIALAALAILLSSIVVLTMAGAASRGREDAYDTQLNAMKPDNPTAEPIALLAYSNALSQLRRPYRIGALTNGPGLFVPETRVWCVKCLRPIAFAAKVCPVCEAPQPVAREEAIGFDGDGGGIPDADEVKYGLKIGDPADDRADSDGDGFSNLDEFKSATNPLDPKSHPRIDELLRVKEIAGTALPLRFMAATKLPDGKVKCQINIRGDSFFVIEGDRIGKTDFVLERFIETKEMRHDPVMNRVREFTVRKVVLKRGSKTYELSAGEDAIVTDYAVVLVLPLDNTEYKVAGDGSFDLRGETYRVISVDSKATTVVIRNDSTGRELTVPPFQ